MSLEETGTHGRVSGFVDSERIVDDRPVDQRYVVVYRLPDDDDNVFEDPGEAHDVVLREPEDEDGNREVEDVWGFYPSSEKAAEGAVELAEEVDVVIWDEIPVLRYPEEHRDTLDRDG